MSKDFYLNERTLAAYVEKDWGDRIVQNRPVLPKFAFAPFAYSQLYSDYHGRLIDFLLRVSGQGDFKPRRLLEVGSSLGRTFYELCAKVKSLDSATLVEPSKNLFTTFGRIFSGEDTTILPILFGNLELQDVVLSTGVIQAACSSVRRECLNKPFQELDPDLGKFDLVICSNVIDQCVDHMQLVRLLKQSTLPSGILLLSCTYQWNDKYLGNAENPVKDINELFDARWTFLGETNLPFRIRVYERYWMSFLSHVVAYRR